MISAVFLVGVFAAQLLMFVFFEAAKWSFGMMRAYQVISWLLSATRSEDYATLLPAIDAVELKLDALEQSAPWTVRLARRLARHEPLRPTESVQQRQQRRVQLEAVVREMPRRVPPERLN